MSLQLPKSKYHKCLRVVPGDEGNEMATPKSTSKEGSYLHSPKWSTSVGAHSSPSLSLPLCLPSRRELQLVAGVEVRAGSDDIKRWKKREGNRENRDSRPRPQVLSHERLLARTLERDVYDLISLALTKNSAMFPEDEKSRETFVFQSLSSENFNAAGLEMRDACRVVSYSTVATPRSMKLIVIQVSLALPTAISAQIGSWSPVHDRSDLTESARKCPRAVQGRSKHEKAREISTDFAHRSYPRMHEHQSATEQGYSISPPPCPLN